MEDDDKDDGGDDDEDDHDSDDEEERGMSEACARDSTVTRILTNARLVACHPILPCADEGKVYQRCSGHTIASC